MPMAAFLCDPFSALNAVEATWQATEALLTLPFDTMREQHACAVQAGLLPRSMLESRDFEHAMATLETMTLGPMARHV